MREARWDKPGPGTWLLDSSHYLAPGPIVRNLMLQSFSRGFESAMSDMGAPLKTMEMRWVNGHFYRRLVPLIGGGRDLPTPPAFVLKIVSRVHPTFRAAERKARVTYDTKGWNRDIDRWDAEWKPAITKTNLELTGVDLAALDDAGLIAHLRVIHDHLLETMALHFRLHAADMGPMGDLMVHLEDWGLARDDTFHAVVAASPATRAPADEVRAIAAALGNAGVDASSLASLDAVRAVPEAARLLDEYLRFHGWRLAGYDIEDHALIELPDVVLGSIRAAAHRGDDPDAGAPLAALRDRVPTEHRATFDDLVADARRSYGLRDENGPLTYEWPAGLLRRALLEVGRRLAGGTRLNRRDDVFELTLDESVGLLSGSSSPDRTEVTRRAEERQWWRSLDAPERLGPEEPPPPVDVLPTNLGRITRVILTVTETLEAVKGGALRGLGIGDTPYVGTARVVHDASEALATMEPGDIVVAPFTAPTYNAVLAMAGGLVTEQGGLLCHAAVIARELGLPAVIGATDALALIPDGATVEVDPAAGAVRVLTA